jgi:pyruvate kinase
MILNPIPTRAEVTDIFNAAMQKTDATMLSWETAAWDYPIYAVKEMANILKVTERQITYKHNYFSRDLWKDNCKKLFIKNAIYTAEDMDVKAILVFTNTWFVAKTAAAYRPNLPVFAFTFSEKVKRKLNIHFGLENFVIDKKSNEENIESAKQFLLDNWLFNSWDKLLVVYDWVDWNDIIPTMKIICV